MVINPIVGVYIIPIIRIPIKGGPDEFIPNTTSLYLSTCEILCEHVTPELVPKFARILDPPNFKKKHSQIGQPKKGDFSSLRSDP